RKDIVNFFLKKGMLVSNDMFDYLEDEKNLSGFCKLIEDKKHENITVLSKKIKEILDYKQPLLEQVPSREKTDIIKKTEPEGNVKIVFSYNRVPKKREANDFIQYFNNRYQAIEKILKQRQELQNITSINRVLNKKDREQLSVIGLVRDKHYTKNGNCILTVEDRTGYTKILANKNKPDLFKIAKEVVLDDVIGVVGVNGDNIIFASNLLFPDIPSTKEIKKANEEVYAIFLSDLHVGSKN
ncbi:unnamed protein product, partial [marine sediment metagenome]